MIQRLLFKTAGESSVCKNLANRLGKRIRKVVHNPIPIENQPVVDTLAKGKNTKEEFLKKYKAAERSLKALKPETKVEVPEEFNRFITKCNMSEDFVQGIMKNENLDMETKKNIFWFVNNEYYRSTNKLIKLIMDKNAEKTINGILTHPDIDPQFYKRIFDDHNIRDTLKNYKYLSKYEMNPTTRYSFSTLSPKELTPKYIKKYQDFITLYQKFVPIESLTISHLERRLERLGITDINEFNNYLKSVNPEQIFEIAPHLKETGISLDFLAYHKNKGTTNFTKEALTLKEDLTDFLSKNLLDDNELLTLYSYYPLTNRAIGSLPKGLLPKSPEQIESVTNTIDEFAHDLTRRHFTESQLAERIKTVEESLSTALGGEKVEVSTLGHGDCGMCYKIKTNEDAYVIKIFYPNSISTSDRNTSAFSEIALGPFLNKNFPEKASEFHYGKVPNVPLTDKSSSYYIKEYIDEHTVRNKIPLAEEEQPYEFFYRDHVRGNKIGDTFIDYGGTVICNKKTQERITFHMSEY